MRVSAPLALRHRVVIGVSLLLAAALAWAVTLWPASGMTPMSGSLAEVLALSGVWIAMMAAMMLPSTLPAVWLFATVAQSRAQFGFRPASTASFVSGYLGTWGLMRIGLGLLNAIGGMLIRAWSQPIAGAALIVAGVYQLTRWKSYCLGHCRAPLEFFMEHWRDGWSGAVLMGAQHGLYCVGCCWALMLGLVGLGMMDARWMGLIAALIFVEKVTPLGERLARLIGVGLIVVGLTIAFGLWTFLRTEGGM